MQENHQRRMLWEKGENGQAVDGGLQGPLPRAGSGTKRGLSAMCSLGHHIPQGAKMRGHSQWSLARGRVLGSRGPCLAGAGSLNWVLKGA